jgi:predicted metal-dependent HD superfamily phosphohydrolase
MPDDSEWKATWAGLGVKAPGDRVSAELTARYSAPERHYHSLRHLDECFARFAESRQLAERPHEIALALWFHDAVYDVRAHDNEERSAAWAEEVARGAGLPADVATRIRELIMATKHDAIPGSNDGRLLVDIDLAILGASVERFDEYERQVRQEYSWVPEPLFRGKRREILEAFLARPHIFSTDYFRSRYEAPARANLERSIAALTDGPAQSLLRALRAWLLRIWSHRDWLLRV